MKWFLRVMPQWVMDIMIQIVVLFSAEVRKVLMLFMMRQMIPMSDEDIKAVITKMTNSIFKLKPEKSKLFAETRLACVTLIPKESAIRLVKPMGQACREGPFKEYVREQAHVQRVILGMPKETQMQIAEIFEAADNTGFLPLEVTIARQEIHKSVKRQEMHKSMPSAETGKIKKICESCNVPIWVLKEALKADCPECGAKINML